MYEVLLRMVDLTELILVSIYYGVDVKELKLSNDWKFSHRDMINLNACLEYTRCVVDLSNCLMRCC